MTLLLLIQFNVTALMFTVQQQLTKLILELLVEVNFLWKLFNAQNYLKACKVLGKETEQQSGATSLMLQNFLH